MWWVNTSQVNFSFLLKMLYIRLIVFHFYMQYEIYLTVVMSLWQQCMLNPAPCLLICMLYCYCDGILKDWKSWFSISDTYNPHVELSNFVSSLWLINRKFIEPIWFYRYFVPSKGVVIIASLDTYHFMPRIDLAYLHHLCILESGLP